MVRFGKYCRYDARLSFFGKLGYRVYGNPHVSKFMHKYYFIRNTKKIMSEKITAVLDVGCGDGDYALYLAEKYPWLEIDAVDNCAKNIAGVRAIQKSVPAVRTVNGICSDIKDFVPSKKYDYIYCIKSLHAISNKRAVLAKLRKFLSENGVLYVQDSTPHSYSNKLLGMSTKPFDGYHKKYVKEELDERAMVAIFKQLNVEIIEKKQIIGFFGQLAWELDQVLQEMKMGVIRPFVVIFFKFLCLLEFAFPWGRKNEICIMGKAR